MEFTREAMLESADILKAKYPGEFTAGDLTDHIDDLLHRFKNRALGDTVFRVGCDLKRKLHRNDRIMGPLIDGIHTGSKVDKILVTFANGLRFRAVDETGKHFPGDLEFSETLHSKGLRYVLCNICELEPDGDSEVIRRIIAATLNGKQ